MKSTNDKTVVLIVYLDDMIITGDNLKEILDLKKMLATKFEIKGWESLRYFLGMEVARSKSGIVISQGNIFYTYQRRQEILGAVDQCMHQRLVEKLIYLSHTRPDIAYSGSIVSQYMNSPNKHHLKGVSGF